MLKPLVSHLFYDATKYLAEMKTHILCEDKTFRDIAIILYTTTHIERSVVQRFNKLFADVMKGLHSIAVKFAFSIILCFLKWKKNPNI